LSHYCIAKWLSGKETYSNSTQPKSARNGVYLGRHNLYDKWSISSAPLVFGNLIKVSFVHDNASFQ
jgi:hypothetical protein